MPLKILAALTLLGAVLRAFQLNSDLWLDEVVSLVTYFRLPLRETVFAYESPNQHVLYSALASLSLSWFGESAWAARLPAAILGAASVPAIYWLARKLTSPRGALLAAALLALSYHHIWFSQSARGYSGKVFCTIVGTALLLEAMESGGVRWWLYALVMAMGIGFLQNTVFVLGGHFVAVILVRRRVSWAQVGATFSAMGLGVVMHAAVLPKMIAFWATEERTGWGSGIGSLEGLVGLIGRGLQAGFLLPGAIVLVAFAGWAGWNLWRTDRRIAVLFVMPSLLGFIAVLVLHYGAYPRAFLHVLPFVFVAIAHLVESGSGRVRIWFVGTLLVCSAMSLGLLYRFPKQDYSGALAVVRQAAQPGEEIAGAGMAGGVCKMFCAPDMEAIRTVEELHRVEAGWPKVWVLYSFTRDMRLRFSDLYDYLEANYETVSIHRGTLDDGTIYVVRRKMDRR
ncbi:MAG: glycosyltransferase family 39 protein [Acidobacteria bacterium]|nr:glycosyltransferase family 39 protein [Acidobacteriota bacterium]